nr:rubrerythrin-like domain-containing protein [Halogranum amylolyticum]
MRDVAYDPAAESEYECFDCGAVTTAKTKPESCPECGGELRNRLTPIE